MKFDLRRVWWIIEAKLGGRIEPKSVQKDNTKNIEKKTGPTGSPMGCKKDLFMQTPQPPPKKQKFWPRGSGSQVWPNCIILWGSQAACPGIAFRWLWIGFNRFKPRL